MAIPSRGIGWGTEENLLWQISKQIEKLTCVTAGGCGSITTTTTTTLPVYRVYTALLTQTGTDTPTVLSNSNLTIGVTYQIKTGSTGPFDFTNVGAPNNNIGTYFVATGTTPNAWAGGFLNYNGGAPVATVLENTIGNVWFTFLNNGEYGAESVGLFIDNKTATFGGYYDADLGIGFRFGNPGYDSNNLVFLRTNDGPPSNGYLQDSTIEIRVYN